MGSGVHPDLCDVHGYRIPVPPEGYNTGDPGQDFRMQMLSAAATEALLAEVRRAYLDSEEMRTLYATFDLSAQVNSPVQRALQLAITSSRKYTRFTFPNCPQLKAKINWILQRHQCEIIRNNHLIDLECQISVHALGRINEVIDFIP